MKVTCPKCHKVIQAPDEWAGRKVKCPGCKDMIKLPESLDGSARDDLGFDISSLGALERGEVLIRERKGKPLSLKEAQEMAAQAPSEEAAPAPRDPSIRICPKCKQKVRCLDPYAEVMCGYCGTGIPSQMENALAKYKPETIIETKQVSFYSGFTTAISYPVRAVASMLGATFILPIVVILPIGAFVALQILQAQNEVSGAADIGWVNPVLGIAGVVIKLYLVAMGFFVLVDTLRVTLIGEEIPPPLSYSPSRIIGVLVPYLPLMGAYAVLFALAYFLFIGPPEQDNLHIWILFTAIVGFPMPMSAIGIASSKTTDGLNPLRVLRSIGRTLGHYCFLDLILVLYGAFAGVLIALVSSLGGLMENLISNKQIALLPSSFVAWFSLLGAGLYCSYMLGRLVGLFARTFKDRLDFDF